MKKKKIFFTTIIGSCLVASNTFAAEPIHLQTFSSNNIAACSPTYYSDAVDTIGEPYILIENSSTSYLTDSDVNWMTPTQLRYAKNEIYARHGRKFKDKELQIWFDSQEWYDGYIEPEDFDESVLSEIEKENILVIQHQLDVGSQNPKTSSESKPSIDSAKGHDTESKTKSSNKSQKSNSSVNKPVSQNNKKTVPNTYTMFNCQYPKDFSADRSKVLKKVQELNGKIVNEKTINVEVKKDVEFKQTLDLSTYKYFGSIKNGKPDGLGVILQPADIVTGLQSFQLPYCYLPVLAGNFKDGKLNGYGMEIGFNGIDMEGTYKDGKLNGDGIVYNNDEIAITNFDVWEDPDTFSSIREEYCLKKYESSLSVIDDNAYDYIDTYEGGNGLIIVDYPVIQPNVFCQGTFSKGKASGKQTVYHPNYKMNQSTMLYEPINKNSVYGPLYYNGNTKNDLKNGKGTTYYANGKIQYEGEFKNNKYHGKGTLYNEDGSVKHKGKFKNGDIQ